MDSNVQWIPAEGDPFATVADAAKNRGAQIVAERRRPQPIFSAPEQPPVAWQPVAGDPFAAPRKGGSDIGPLLGQGAAAIVQGVTYPLDKLLGGSLGKAFEEHVGRNLNDIMGDVQQTYQAKLSPDQQAASQKEFISGKDGEIFGEAWADPKAYKGLIVSNLPSMVPGFGAAALASRGARVYGTMAARAALESGMAPELAAKVGQEAAVKAAGRIGAVAGAATEGIIGGGQQGAQTESEIMAMPEDKLQQSQFYQGLLRTMSPKEAREQIAHDAGTQAMLIAGVVDGVTGGAFDSYLAKTLTGGGSGKLLQEIGRGMAREGATETVQSGGEQLATNIGVRSQADPTRPLGQGVANAAVSGGIAGAAMGVGAGGGAHAGAQPLVTPPGDAGAPNAQPAAEAPPPNVVPPAFAGGPPGAPSEPVQPEGLPLQYPGAAPYSSGAPAGESTETPDFTPPLSPIDQARTDAQILKAGNPLDADGTRQRNAQLVATYGENAAVRHVIDGGMDALGEAMLRAAPMVERVRGTIQNNEKSRDITDDILAAVDEIGKLKGQDINKVLAEGVSHDLSYEGQQLMQFLAENVNDPKRIAAFLENYLQEVENATGIPSQVRGRAFDIIEERRLAKEKQVAEAKEKAFKETERTQKREKAATELKAREENQSKKAEQAVAVGKASGSGIQPNHKTAIELAFERALKGRNEKSKPVPDSPSGGPQGGQPQKPAGPAPRPVSQPVKAGDLGNPRPVRAVGHPPGAGADVQATEVNRGAAIAAERQNVAQAPVDAAAHEAATSPHNDLPAPTEAQREAGNYKKGPVKVGGLEVSVENPAGSKRRPEWPTLESHYGYVKGEVETIMARARRRMLAADPEILEAKPNVEDWLSKGEKSRMERLQTGMSGAETARRARLSRQAAARKRIDLNADSITTATIKLGGISTRNRNEMLKDGKNPNVPFVGYLFNERGRGPDELTGSLHDLGYLSAEEMADHGGVPALADYLAAEAKGAEPHLSERRDGNTQDAELERQRDIAAQQEAAQKTPEELADEAGDRPSDWSTMTDEEKDAEIDALFASHSSPAAGNAPEGGEVAAGEMGPGEREPGQDDEESFDLQQQTPQDLAARASEQDAAAKAEAKAASDKEAADKAERERKEIAQRSQAAAGEFTLGAQVNDKDAQKAADKAKAERDLSGQKPMFSRFDRGTRGGLHIDDLRALSKAIKMAYPIRATGSIDEWPADLRKLVDEAAHNEGIDAAFYDGEIWLAGDRIPDLATAQNRILHEGLHGGLKGLFGDALSPELVKIYLTNPDMRESVAKFREQFPDLSLVEATEEVLVSYGAEAPKLTGWSKFVSWIRNWLRGHGFAKSFVDGYTDNDVVHLLQMAGQVAEGKKLGQNRYSGHSAFSTRYSRTVAPKWSEGLPQAQQDALKKAGVITEEKTLAERARDLKADFGKKFTQGLFDQFAPIKELDYKAYMLARMSKGSDGGLEAMMMYGRPYLDGGALNVGMEGGLMKVFQDLQGEHDRFLSWIAGNRAEQLKRDGKENLFTDDDISALKDLNQGQMPDQSSRDIAYANAHQKFNAYMNAVLDIAQDTGLIDPESRDIWAKDFYVPFYRVMEEGGGPTVKSGLVNQYAFKKLKGGKTELRDLMANTLRNWSHLLSASLKNQAALASLEAAVSAGAAIEVPSDHVAKQMGLDTSVLKVLDHGVHRYFMVEDPFLLDAITAMEWNGFKGPAMDALGTFKRALTVGVTANPTFKIRNLMRDTVAAVSQNNLSYNAAKNLAQGWRLTKHGQTRASMMASGALMRFGTLMEGNTAAHTKRLIEAGVDANTILDKPHKVVAMLQKAWDAYQELGDRGEQVNRAALYQQLRDKGLGHLEASFQARDMLDFSMQGKWAAVRFLTQVVPFMNARLQGMYKLGRAAKDDPARMGYVLGALSIASMALLLWNHDDDDWKKREEWDRDQYWWVKVGGVAFRIPKPFEIGAMASVADRSLEFLISDEKDPGKRFLKSMGNLISNNLSMNPIPQLVKPLIDLYANKDSFTGRDIETQGMERLSKDERVGRGTTLPAQILAMLDPTDTFSPVQVDFLARAYFGWLGTTVLVTLDYGMRPLSDQPGKASMELRQFPVLGNFVEGLPASQSRYLTLFYDEAKKIEESYADYRNALRQGDTGKAASIMQNRGELIRQEQVVASTKRSLSALGQAERKIELSEVSPDAKRAMLDATAARKDELARRIAR